MQSLLDHETDGPRLRLTRQFRMSDRRHGTNGTLQIDTLLGFRPKDNVCLSIRVPGINDMFGDCSDAVHFPSLAMSSSSE